MLGGVEVLEIRVDLDAIRIDKYLSDNTEFSRSKIKKLIDEGNIIVSGNRVKSSYIVHIGDIINIDNSIHEYDEEVVAEDIPLDIVYEDDNVCVVNKKQGMVTHPASGNWSGTLVNALLFHWNRQSIPELKTGSASEILSNRRPGIVHRLDKDTSGLIITAKNRDTEEFLGKQFRNHNKIYKEYICICMGRPQHSHGIIETQIIRDPKDRKRFKAVVGTDKGKFASSYYRCISCYGEYSLMRVRINTGRTHQIRVHMKYLNCPILGDQIYSRPDRKFPGATLMLHSRKMRIYIPGIRNKMEFVSPTPPRFVEVMKILKKDYPKTILPDDR